ncbi:hypothetical protein GGI25_006001 [Coemansia spiralis]|uniref:Galactose oxidase n=2 Tax=Coemansia TaxID=4863 RepID=A0A9W8G1U2_9FUNG|nr:hypothetical protein EDC05_005967 [Coemansia umbellata]KAJ2619063.1 hypothetical protein GGI26_006121 [Coemansia sp. RSA 1358]KAJ2669905.1 hypothetical protein GGI25_006001 [Coemansia spiralis]
MPAAENDLTELYIRSFKCTGDVPPALVGSSVTYLDGQAYVFGGRTLHTGKLSNDIYICDLRTFQWRRLNSTEPRKSPLGTSAAYSSTQHQEHGGQPPAADTKNHAIASPSPRFFHSTTSFKHYLIVFGGMGLDVDNDTAHVPPAVHNSLQDDRNQQSFQMRASKTLLGDIAIFDTREEHWVALSVLATGEPADDDFQQNTPSSADDGQANNQSPSPRYAHLATLFGNRLLIIGGQDLEEQYVEELNVFDLQLGRWIMRSPFPRAVGLYRSFIGSVPATGTTLLYSNYSFASVKRALYSLSPPPDCTLNEISESLSGEPPGLRFPRGHLVDPQTIIMTGTLISTEGHSELSVWSLDTKALRWQPVSCGAKFRAGSWNQSLVDPRTNTLVLFGDSRRDLTYDYQRRRLNYNEIRTVDLRALGYLRTPLKLESSPGFMAAARAAVTRVASLPTKTPASPVQSTQGGRTAGELSYEMGSQFLFFTQFSDAEIIGADGKRVAGANSGMLRARWPAQAQMWLAGDNAAAANFAKMSDDSENTKPEARQRLPRNHRPESSLLSGDYDTASDDGISLPEGPRRYFIDASREAIYVLLFYLYTDSIDAGARLGPQQASADASVLCDELGTVSVLGELLVAARKYSLHKLALRTVNILRCKVNETTAPVIYEAALRAGHQGLQARCVIAAKDAIASLRMDRKSTLYMISNASRASLIRFFPKLNADDGGANYNDDMQSISSTVNDPSRIGHGPYHHQQQQQQQQYMDSSRQRSTSDAYNNSQPTYMLPSPSASPASTVRSGQARSPFPQQQQQQEQLGNPRRPWETTAAMMSSPVINSPASSRYSNQSPDVRMGESKRMSTNFSSFVNQPLTEGPEAGYSPQYDVSPAEQSSHTSNRMSRYFGAGNPSSDSVVNERRPSNSSATDISVLQHLQQQHQQQQQQSTRSLIFRPWAKMKKIASSSQVSSDSLPPIPSHASAYSTNSAN